MSQVTLTFEVDEELQAEIAKLATASNRTAAQLLRDAAEDYVRRQREAVDYDTWLDREIEEGLREADDPNAEWIPQEEAMAGIRAKLEARVKAGGR